jgi:transcription antitermination protein NusB
MKQVSLLDVLAGLSVAPDPFTVALLQGVQAEEERVDELVGSAAVGWELSRMPVVDRTILRLATWELLARADIPVAVVIDEAVELAKQYSTEQSGGFVNGVLSTIASEVRPA